MAKFDVVVIGASAGGVGFLQRLVERLPVRFGSAVFVAMHFPDGVRSMLPAILQRAGPLPVLHAENGAPIRTGHIYVAPPGFQLTLDQTRMCVSRGAREHGMRPAIDPLFRSAALSAGPRAIGVVLSGLLDDGTIGLQEIKKAGGVAVVQDPAETPFPSMPESALAHVDVDYCLPAAEIGELLHKLVAPADEGVVAPAADETLVTHEVRDLTMREDAGDQPGEPSPYVCPECGGVLWEITDAEMMRFRCRAGHAYTSDTLTIDQARTVEQALWTALRALEEQAAVRRRLAERARRWGHQSAADLFDRHLRELEVQAQGVRNLLLSGAEGSD